MNPYRSFAVRDPDPSPPLDKAGALRAATVSFFGASVVSLVAMTLVVGHLTSDHDIRRAPALRWEVVSRPQRKCEWVERGWINKKFEQCDVMPNGHARCMTWEQPTLHYELLCETTWVHERVQVEAGPS